MDNIELKKAGLKVTLPRLKILNLLETADTRHLSAEDVYKMLLTRVMMLAWQPCIGATQFESAGLVLRHNFEGATLSFELNNDEHHDLWFAWIPARSLSF